MKPKSEVRAAFTLIEMLVVITIIAILAAILLPAINAARQRARAANCRSNLHHFGSHLEFYYSDNNVRVPYLSGLYPEYDLAKDMLICPADSSRGTDGSKPTWDPGDRFPETNELPSNKAGTAAFEQEAAVKYHRAVPPNGSEYKINFLDIKQVYPYTLRNQEIEACSYIYEFTVARCPFAVGALGAMADETRHRGNGDGVTSWAEYKEAVEMNGLQPDGSYNKELGWRQCVPVVRCFHHTTPRFDSNDIVINLGGHFGVYDSDPTADGWKQKCQPTD
jgi:prepilin-type N-terminal cleavage/methylation domain-containing protein